MFLDQWRAIYFGELKVVCFPSLCELTVDGVKTGEKKFKCILPNLLLHCPTFAAFLLSNFSFTSTKPSKKNDVYALLETNNSEVDNILESHSEERDVFRFCTVPNR